MCAGRPGEEPYPGSADHSASPGFPGSVTGSFFVQAAVRAHFVRILTIDVVRHFLELLGPEGGSRVDRRYVMTRRGRGSMVFPNGRDRVEAHKGRGR